jgi:hypothetical protein
MPGSGTFALAGLRIFGTAGGELPGNVDAFGVERLADRCIVDLHWTESPDAVGYNIRFGTQKDKLYHNYQVLGNNSVTIRSLNSKLKYYFTIDVFNENGITKGTDIIEVE